MFPLSYSQQKRTGDRTMDTNIAENLKKIREKHSITQEALAEALGINAIVVYMWEAGRLPIEYKALVKIADFYDVTVESLLGDAAEANSKPSPSDKVSFSCRICGGELVYDYNAATCKCANCGNKWAIAELYPKYDRIITTINKASRILSGKPVLASADEAKLLLQQAITECSKYNDAISPELIKICNEGQEKAEQLEIYCRGKYFFENKSYKSALNEFEKVRGYRDADEMIKRCKGRP